MFYYYTPPLYGWYYFKGKQRFTLGIFYVVRYFHWSFPRSQTGNCCSGKFYLLRIIFKSIWAFRSSYRRPDGLYAVSFFTKKDAASIPNADPFTFDTSP